MKWSLILMMFPFTCRAQDTIYGQHSFAGPLIFLQAKNDAAADSCLAADSTGAVHNKLFPWKNGGAIVDTSVLSLTRADTLVVFTTGAVTAIYQLGTIINITAPVVSYEDSLEQEEDDSLLRSDLRPHRFQMLESDSGGLQIGEGSLVSSFELYIDYTDETGTLQHISYQLESDGALGNNSVVRQLWCHAGSIIRVYTGGNFGSGTSAITYDFEVNITPK